MSSPSVSPAGSGLLYVRRAARPHIQPTYLDEGFQSYTQCTGTTPLQTIAGLGYAFAYLTAAGGLEALRAHVAHLYSLTYGLLREEARIELLSAAPGSGVRLRADCMPITCRLHAGCMLACSSPLPRAQASRADDCMLIAPLRCPGLRPRALMIAC